MAVDYDKHLDVALASLHDEGRYRVFTDLARSAGRFPRALNHSVNPPREVTVWCSNDYLGMGQNADVMDAMKHAIDTMGTGAGGTRNISGTHRMIVELKNELSDLHGKEAALVFTSGYISNEATISTLAKLLPDCLILSDELNHASMIEGVRQSGCSKLIWRHNDIEHLESLLRDADPARPKLIAFESVYSMDGDIAPLDEINKLAEEFGAMVYVDDCHGEGVLGETGAGIVDHFKLQGKVDFEVGSFSKALGVQGGIVAGSEDTRNHALNHSRSWLLSGSQPPGVAAAQKAAIEVLMEEPEHHKKLWENTNYFRKELQSLGFDTGVSTTPIIPVMCGQSSTAKELSTTLGENGVMAGAIVFPMVARDKARVRTQMSAGLSRDDLDEVLRIFENVGGKLGLI